MLNVFYNSFVLEIFESKFQFRFGVVFNFKIFDKIFFFQYVGDCYFQFGGRYGDCSFVCGLIVMDMGQYICDWILYVYLFLFL